MVGVAFKSNFHSTAPLEPSSGHVPSVHISWPKARIRDIHKLSSNEELAMEAIKKFLNRFKSHYIDTAHLQLLPSKNIRYENKPNQDTFWIILPYHPTIFRMQKRQLVR